MVRPSLFPRPSPFLLFSALPFLCITVNTTRRIKIREGRQRGGGRVKEGRRAANEPKLLCSSLYGANSIKSIMGRGGLRTEIENGDWGGEDGERHGKKRWTSALYCFCMSKILIWTERQFSVIVWGGTDRCGWEMREKEGKGRKEEGHWGEEEERGSYQQDPTD